MSTTPGSRRGFTLMELLVVMAIIGVLVGMLIPGLSWARRRANAVKCASNLNQIGTAIQIYLNNFDNVYPVARYMPSPFVTLFPDTPGLPKALESQIETNSPIYQCPGDNIVYKTCGMSYVYSTRLSGRDDDATGRRFTIFTREETAVAYDCDGGTYFLDNGQITTGPFHADRNVLFKDGHVGKYNLDDSPPPADNPPNP